jgi:hypothetical protein
VGAAILRDARKSALVRIRARAERVTFDDVRKFALVWAEVEDGSSHGSKKLLARLREDNDSPVMLGVPPARHADREPAENFFTSPITTGLSDGADSASQGKARHCRTAAAPGLAGARAKGRGQSFAPNTRVGKGAPASPCSPQSSITFMTACTLLLCLPDAMP